MQRLDELLSDLKRESPEDLPAELEARVWRGIDQLRERRRPIERRFGVRAAQVLAALAFGMVAGASVGSASAAHNAPFSMAADLAPSTLLEGG